MLALPSPGAMFSQWLLKTTIFALTSAMKAPLYDAPGEGGIQAI